MTSLLPTRTPAPPPAAMLPPAPAPAPAVDGALVLATLAVASTVTPVALLDGMSTPELNGRLQELGFGSNPLSVLGHLLEDLYAQGLVGHYRPPNYRAEAGHRVCAQRRYWVTDEGRAWVGQQEDEDAR